jgi:hypothetical protein
MAGESKFISVALMVSVEEIDDERARGEDVLPV